jgi:hypothetical protein
MGGVGHICKGEDQCTPNGQSEVQIAFGVDWGVAGPSQSPPQAKKKCWCSLPYDPQTSTRSYRDKEVVTYLDLCILTIGKGALSLAS